MYQKYQTDALVVGARETGEADKTFALYTRDFGLVWARATSVRKETSKMRYALQLYSRANISLVKGKRGWRAAGASATLGSQGKDRKGVAAFARASELIVRLVAGEEENAYLFDTLAEAHDALMRQHVEAHATIEIVAAARILFTLGYISAEALETALFTHTAYAESHLVEAEAMRHQLLSHINRAISETQL